MTPTPLDTPHRVPHRFFWRFFGACLFLVACAFWLSRVSVATRSPALTIAAGILLALLLAGFVSRSVSRSIRRIAAAAERMADGDLGARAIDLPADEMGALGRTLNTMGQHLEQRVHELEAQRNQAQAILESLGEGVVALDRDGRVLWLNASAQRLFSLNPGQAAGRRFVEFVRRSEVEALVQHVLHGRQPAACELHTFAPREQVIRLQGAPCEGPAGDAALVLVAQDVTEMRRFEGMRREFVANVSHELKTPLTSIRGLVETLLSGALEDQANNRRFVSLIDEDATRLTRLIDDLLELSRIESKALPLAREVVRLQPLLEEIVTSLQRGLTQRRLAVTLEIEADLRVKGDPEGLRQVFLNLIDNAIKYNTAGGCVTLRARRDPAHITITVADTGVGIPPTDLPRIFERFYRVDKARSRALGGTGLGLSIVKHIVEAHGGTVSVHSRLGEGSTFTIVLPA